MSTPIRTLGDRTTNAQAIIDVSNLLIFRTAT